jgi:hypothetical protein
VSGSALSGWCSEWAIGPLKERYPRVARYYELAVNPDTAQFSATLKEDERAAAAQLDGCYLIKTDRSDLSAQDFWHVYALLTRAGGHIGRETGEIAIAEGSAIGIALHDYGSLFREYSTGPAMS